MNILFCRGFSYDQLLSLSLSLFLSETSAAGAVTGHMGLRDMSYSVILLI